MTVSIPITEEAVRDLIISVGEPMSPGEIADEFGVSTQTVRRYTTRLVARGVLAVEGSTRSRRFSHVPPAASTSA